MRRQPARQVGRSVANASIYPPNVTKRLTYEHCWPLSLHGDCNGVRPTKYYVTGVCIDQFDGAVSDVGVFVGVAGDAADRRVQSFTAAVIQEHAARVAATSGSFTQLQHQRQFVLFR